MLNKSDIAPCGHMRIESMGLGRDPDFENTDPAGFLACPGYDADTYDSYVEALVDAARGGLDSMRWMSNNLHNYGTEQWRSLFVAAMEDVERAREALTPFTRETTDDARTLVWVCSWEGCPETILDEQALEATLSMLLEALEAQGHAPMQPRYPDDGLFCQFCSAHIEPDGEASDYVPWPCPAAQALSAARGEA